MFISLRLLHAYSITTMTSTILLLNLFPCICLTALNRSIYNAQSSLMISNSCITRCGNCARLRPGSTRFRPGALLEPGSKSFQSSGQRKCLFQVPSIFLLEEQKT